MLHVFDVFNQVTTNLNNDSRNYEYTSESVHVSVPREALDQARAMSESNVNRVARAQARASSNSYPDRIVFVEYKENILFQTKDNDSTDSVSKKSQQNYDTV